MNIIEIIELKKAIDLIAKGNFTFVSNISRANQLASALVENGYPINEALEMGEKIVRFDEYCQKRTTDLT